MCGVRARASAFIVIFEKNSNRINNGIVYKRNERKALLKVIKFNKSHAMTSLAFAVLCLVFATGNREIHTFTHSDTAKQSTLTNTYVRSACVVASQHTENKRK